MNLMRKTLSLSEVVILSLEKHCHTLRIKNNQYPNLKEHHKTDISMKVSKTEIKYLGQLIFTWAFVNLALNLIGLFTTKMLNESLFSYFDSITTEFVVPLIIQSLL